MKITSIDNISISTNIFNLVGVGTTALCFKQNDGRVLKLYRDTSRKAMLFKHREKMIDFLSELSKINNDSYIGPKEIIVKNDEVIGYLMDYKKANTLKRINKNFTITYILDSIPKLLEDTYEVSDLGYRIFDMHLKNILYDEAFYIIDTDGGNLYGKEEYISRNILESNLCNLYSIIIDGIFGVEYNYFITFYDKDLDDLYCKLAYKKEEKNIYLFINELCERLKMDNPTIKEIRENQKLVLKKEKRDAYYT